MALELSILAVDDNRVSLEYLSDCILRVNPYCNLYSYTVPTEALEKAKELGAALQIAFLDIEMEGLNGIELAAKLYEVCPDIKIVFVTSHENYTYDAFHLHAFGYLMKPFNLSDIRKEMKELYQIAPLSSKEKLTVQCFGNFCLFLNHKAFSFDDAKSMEIFALLIDGKGEFLDAHDIATTVTGISSDLLETRIRAIANTLKANDIDDVLITKNGKYAIDTQNVDCDYYNLLRGNDDSAHSFVGQYMQNYHWAEKTARLLSQKKATYQG